MDLVPAPRKLWFGVDPPVPGPSIPGPIPAGDMSFGPYIVPSARLTSALADSGNDIPDFMGELDVINGIAFTFCCTAGPLPSLAYGAAAGRLDPPLALLSDCIASVVIRGPAPLPDAPSVVSGKDGVVPALLFPEQPVTISNVQITTMASKCFTVSPKILKWTDAFDAFNNQRL